MIIIITNKEHDKSQYPFLLLDAHSQKDHSKNARFKYLLTILYTSTA